MVEKVRRDQWPRGINNRANWRNLPDGAVADAVNLDFLEGGSVGLRAGFDQVYAGTDVRGALAVGTDILVADGNNLVRYDRLTNTTSVIGTIAGAGRFTGAVMNGELFFCTENETFRYRAGVLRRWGVPTVTTQPIPTVGSGALAAGTYQWAVTYVSAAGEEGGVVSATRMAVGNNAALQFDLAPPAGYQARLYVGANQGGNLYLQFEGSGAYTVTTVRDDTARMDTMHLREPVTGDYIASHNGVLAIAAGNVVWMTRPLRPHLRNAARGFFQFAEPVGMVVSADGGLFVSADKTYFIRDAETGEPQQSGVFDFPAVPGSGTTLPDGKAVWMTAFGVAVSDGQGGAALISQDNFVPELATRGSSGIVDHNGNRQVVTTLTGARGANPLAAGDYYEAEIIYP